MGTCSKRCTHGYRRDAGGCSQCACLREYPNSELTSHASDPRRYLEVSRFPAAADSVTGEEVPSRNCTGKQRGRVAEEGRISLGFEREPRKSRRFQHPDATGTVVDAAGGGRDRDDGEYWSDGCRGCYCAAGRTLCELASCKDDPTALRRMAELALCSDNKGKLEF